MIDRCNIVLTGFMGTGKTSVGHALAGMLNRQFIDMDVLMQEREGATIAELFTVRGEPGFRELETALIHELAGRENLVIATGGGALVNAENRAAFAGSHVICLDASAEEILGRLHGANDRPLLQGDKRARIEELLAARQEAYRAIPIHVDTNGRIPKAIAREIADRLTTREIAVETPEGSYPIFLGEGLLDRVGELLRGQKTDTLCAVVTNPTVGALYAKRVLTSLRAQNFSPVLVEIPDGEQYKSLDTLRDLYDQFIAARLERRSPILALGGGVIGDTVGVAAATYLRGVPFVQIPTTLLSMVDSSIGGKVAVDHAAGKNLIGAFKFPVCVIQDLAVLETLPIEEYRAGMAEVIKHGVLGDAGLFRDLQKGAPLDAALLERALQVKIDVVQRDPYENNIRAHLNLGHTFGQAIERLAEYRMRHGYAVAMGMSVAARLAANLELCSGETRDKILAILEQYELPTRIPDTFTPEQILEAMGTDKKIQSGKLRFILPTEIGKVEIVSSVTRDEIVQAITESYPAIP